MLLVRSHTTSDYLLLAQAAKLAGQPEHSWAALGEFVQRHRGRPLARSAARRVRAVASDLPASAYGDAVKPLLRKSLR